jgi:hypothetical protein
MKPPLQVINIKKATDLARELQFKDLMVYLSVAIRGQGDAQVRARRGVQGALDIDEWMRSKGYVR